MKVRFHRPRLDSFLRPVAAPLLLLVVTTFSALGQPYWPQFRGPSGQAIAKDAHPPLSFSVADAAWSAELGPGHSSPCIWGERLFLSTFTSGKLECCAYNRVTGKLLWKREVAADKIESTHPYRNPAAPTPAATDKEVVFYFGSYGLMAFTHDGKELWNRKFPAPVSRGGYGSASSPVLCGDLIIQVLDTDQGGSRLLAVKKSTGETAWETPRPLFSAGWATPVVWPGNGQPQIVVLGSKKVIAYRPDNGKEIWSVPGFPLETTPSPAFDDQHLFACSTGVGGRSNPHFDGSAWTDLLKFDANKDGKIQITEVPDSYRIVQRPELPEGHPGRLLPFNVRDMLAGMDQDKDGAVSKEEWDASMAEFEKMDSPVLMALRPGSAEADPAKRIAWQMSRGIPEIPSPLCYDGKLFLVRDGGLLQCLSADSGKVLYQERLGVSGGYAASPVAANGRVYFASQSGTLVVIDSHPEQLTVLARNPLGEKIAATPALAEDKIYVRTEKHLYAFAAK